MELNGGGSLCQTQTTGPWRFSLVAQGAGWVEAEVAGGGGGQGWRGLMV